MMTDQPFSLLSRLYTDGPMRAIFSEEATVRAWLEVEAALARGQAELGLIPTGDAEAIATACRVEAVDLDRLWSEAANVGYPILPLVRQLSDHLPAGPDGRVHLGATTQDIMDSGLALQLRQALDRLDSLCIDVGDALAGLVERHRDTVLAARTHGLQAVPTTLGAKLAVLVDEVIRHRERLAQLRPRVCRLSMFGAGGTSAAYGERVAELRRTVAVRLGLAVTDIPWHVARDGLAELTFTSAAMAKTCARLAREVIDLSRTEIDELREADGHHRGASSTMPQKANPIWAEGIVGLAVSAATASAAMLRAMEAGHERAAGEWHAEWDALPRVVCLSAAALSTAARLLRGLRVDPEAMRRNLSADGGALMAEAYMIRFAPALGRERAHDLVYEMVRAARASGRSLAEEVTRRADEAGELGGQLPIPPEAYLGDAARICTTALARWRESTPTEGSDDA